MSRLTKDDEDGTVLRQGEWHNGPAILRGAGTDGIADRSTGGIPKLRFLATNAECAFALAGPSQEVDIPIPEVAVG